MNTKIAALVKAMKEKKANRGASVRLALVSCPGALAGAYGAGVVTALVNEDFSSVFDWAVGISTGAPGIGYKLTMRPGGDGTQNIRYSTVYSGEARSDYFFKSRFRLDVPWLVDVFRGSTGKAIEWEKVNAHPARYVIVASDWETGRPVYLEPTSSEEMFKAIEASISVPIMSPPVAYSGRLLTDGVISDPLPVQWLMSLPEDERPTHILVIANAWSEPPPQKWQRLEQLGMDVLLRHRAPSRIRSLITGRHERFYRSAAEALARTDVTVVIDWLPWAIHSMDRNSFHLDTLIQSGYIRWYELLQDT